MGRFFRWLGIAIALVVGGIVLMAVYASLQERNRHIAFSECGLLHLNLKTADTTDKEAAEFFTHCMGINGYEPYLGTAFCVSYAELTNFDVCYKSVGLF